MYLKWTDKQIGMNDIARVRTFLKKERSSTIHWFATAGGRLPPHAFREFFPGSSIEFEQLLKKPQLNLSHILNHIEPSLEWINSIQFPHVHNTAKKLVPHNTVAKFFDTDSQIIYWAFAGTKPCFFDEKLEASYFSC